MMMMIYVLPIFTYRCTLNKGILIISFDWDNNMPAMSIVFCVSWDCVKAKD